MATIGVKDKIYLACFLDSEGSVGLARLLGKPGYARIAVTFTNSYIPILYWIKRHYGGSIKDHHKSGFGGKKKCWQLAIGSLQAVKLLNDILPYMRIKKKRAEAVLRFARRLTHNGEAKLGHRGWRRLTQGEIRIRERMLSRLQLQTKRTGR